MFSTGADIININCFTVFLTEHFVVATTDCYGRIVVFVGREKLGDKAFSDTVIAVNKTDKITSRFFQAEVTCGRLAGVFLVKNFDARIFFGVVIGNFAGIIGGAIVDKDDF